MATLSASSGIYSQGNVISQYPIPAASVFLGVVLFSALLRFGLSAADSVTNKYFRLLFGALLQQVMIVGLLVLSMAFAESLHDFSTDLILIFQWSMLLLFFTTVLFVVVHLLVLKLVTVSSHRWEAFETSKMNSEAALSAREEVYKLCFEQFQIALRAFDYNTARGIFFHEYLSKINRRHIVVLTKLSWVGWVSLSTLVILNTLRSQATQVALSSTQQNLEATMTTEQRVITYASCIVIDGYGILVLFLVLHFVLSRRLRAYLSHCQTDRITRSAAAARDELQDSRVHLLRGSIGITLEAIQVLLLLIEWYTAYFFLSFANEIVYGLGAGIAAALFVAAILPLVIVVATVQWTVTIVSLLASLGTNLDEDAVRYLVIRARVPFEQWPRHMRDAYIKQVREREGAPPSLPNLSFDDVSQRGSAADLPQERGGGLASVDRTPWSSRPAAGRPSTTAQRITAFMEM